MEDKSRWIRQKVFRRIFKKFHTMTKGLDADLEDRGPRNLAADVTSTVRQIEQTNRTMDSAKASVNEIVASTLEIKINIIENENNS